MNAALEAKVRRKPQRIRPTTEEHETRLARLERRAISIVSERDDYRDKFHIALLGNPFSFLVGLLIGAYMMKH